MRFHGSRNPSSRKAVLTLPPRSRWHRRTRSRGRSIPIELMGTFTAGRLFGKTLGAGGLVPEPRGLRIVFMMGMHAPIWIPAEQLVSVRRYVGIPFLEWGLCIRHTLTDLPSPLYFSSCRRPKQVLAALEGYAWAAADWRRG